MIQEWIHIRRLSHSKRLTPSCWRS